MTHRKEEREAGWFTVQDRRYFRVGGAGEGLGDSGLHQVDQIPPGLNHLLDRVPGWSQGKKRDRCPSQGQFTCCSRLKTRVATPGWSKMELFQRSSLSGCPYFSPTESPIINAKMPSNTTTTTMIIISFFRA